MEGTVSVSPERKNVTPARNEGFGSHDRKKRGNLNQGERKTVKGAGKDREQKGKKQGGYISQDNAISCPVGKAEETGEEKTREIDRQISMKPIPKVRGEDVKKEGR